MFFQYQNNEAKRNITTSVEVSHKACKKLKTKATENRVKEEMSEEIILQKDELNLRACTVIKHFRNKILFVCQTKQQENLKY